MVGAEMEESDQENILNRSNWSLVFGPHILIVHTGMGGGMDSMILRMSMGSSMAGTVVLRMGMGGSNMESLRYPHTTTTNSITFSFGSIWSTRTTHAHGSIWLWSSGSIKL